MINSISKLRNADRDKLDRILSARRRRLLKWIQSHTPRRGLPRGLSQETVSRICREVTGEELRRSSYVHLSGWKVSGAYRLTLKTQSGRTWPLIFKNAVYNLEELPGLQGMPQRPGPPEYLVYKNASPALSEFLPKVYLCLEIRPGSHYQYLLEDLSRSHRRLSPFGGTEPAGNQNLRAAIEQLPLLHDALTEWLHGVDPSAFLRYDDGFSDAFLSYAKDNLEGYFAETQDETVSRVLKFWPQISNLHESADIGELRGTIAIHGDYHNGHMYTDDSAGDNLKLIDWEWSGFGWPHADLASALKRATPEDEELALSIYAERMKNFTPAEHRRLYEWCQFERGLMDAAYLAKQQMEAPRKVGWVPPYIRRSLRRALRALDALG